MIDFPPRIYLEDVRGVFPPRDAYGDVIRWHRALSFQGQTTGAAVMLCRDVLTNERRAIHRTFLTPDGRKREINDLSKASLGPTRGCAIKFWPDDQIGDEIAIGEGAESALSVRGLAGFEHVPAWSLISAGGLAAFPVLSQVRHLVIAVDNDPKGVGQRAADKVATRWKRAGREVTQLVPKTVGADLNDVILGRAA